MFLKNTVSNKTSQWFRPEQFIKHRNIDFNKFGSAFCNAFRQ